MCFFFKHCFDVTIMCYFVPVGFLNCAHVCFYSMYQYDFAQSKIIILKVYQLKWLFLAAYVPV